MQQLLVRVLRGIAAAAEMCRQSGWVRIWGVFGCRFGCAVMLSMCDSTDVDGWLVAWEMCACGRVLAPSSPPWLLPFTLLQLQSTWLVISREQVLRYDAGCAVPVLLS